jgi:hypothetical protein
MGLEGPRADHTSVEPQPDLVVTIAGFSLADDLVVPSDKPFSVVGVGGLC